jgi:histidine kinase/DNA gyrase B/HSP90-like ATPase
VAVLVRGPARDPADRERGRRRADTAGAFPQRVRRRVLVYVAVTLPLVTLVGAFARGEDDYIAVWTLAGGIYTTPALAATWRAMRRSPRDEHGFWTCWFVALCLVSVCGMSLSARAQTGWDLRLLSAVGLGGAVLAYALGLWSILRERSGTRLVVIDSIEALMATTLVGAPLFLAFGPRLLDAEAAWFAAPAAIVAAVSTVELFLAVAMMGRLPPDARDMAWLGCGFAGLALANALANAAQGVSGFDLPSAPLVALQAAWMAFVLLMPVHALTYRVPGLDRLVPHAQTRSPRTTAFLAALALVMLPLLTTQAIVIDDRVTWAPVFALVTLAWLLVLATGRHLFTVVETRRLHVRVGEASDERRRLLDQVLRSVEDDRRRVAMKLHVSAVASYAALAAMAPSTLDARATGDDSAVLNEAIAAMAAELKRHAESLRQLVVAVEPLDVSGEADGDDSDGGGDGGRSDSGRGLEPGMPGHATLLSAYLESLYGDEIPPRLDVVMPDEMVLDWTTETIVSRIVKEALHNVWRHASARAVTVSVVPEGAEIEVTVTDDGDGFDPASVRSGSGIATMRAFAALASGRVDLESRPGGGTTVVARLSTELEPPPAAGRPRLRLVHSQGNR